MLRGPKYSLTPTTQFEVLRVNEETAVVSLEIIFGCPQALGAPSGEIIFDVHVSRRVYVVIPNNL